MDDRVAVREDYLSGDLEGAARRVSDRLVKAVTIAGTPEECRRQLAQWIETYSAMGVNQFAFAVAPKPDRETSYREALEVITGSTTRH